MIDRIRAAVSLAAENGIRVAFFGVDSSRADSRSRSRRTRARSRRAPPRSSSSTRSGSRRPRQPRTSSARSRTASAAEVPVHWHGHDDFGLATAAAVAAVQAGASWVQGTVNGMGERAGNADLLEVALALEALYGIPTRLRLERRRELAKLVEELSETPLAPWKPLTGDEPLHARVGRCRCAIPRSAGDRAVRVGARRRGAGDRPREEERHRLHPHQARGARARLPGGSPGGASRAGQAARRQEARPRHRRGVQADREPEAGPDAYELTDMSRPGMIAAD